MAKPYSHRTARRMRIIAIHGHNVSITRYRLGRANADGHHYVAFEYDIDGPSFVARVGNVPLDMIAEYLKVMKREILARSFAGVAS